MQSTGEYSLSTHWKDGFPYMRHGKLWHLIAHGWEIWTKHVQQILKSSIIYVRCDNMKMTRKPYEKMQAKAIGLDFFRSYGFVKQEIVKQFHKRRNKTTSHFRE